MDDAKYSMAFLTYARKVEAYLGHALTLDEAMSLHDSWYDGALFAMGQAKGLKGAEIEPARNLWQQIKAVLQ